MIDTPEPYVFESRTVRPDGIRVTVTAVIPSGVAWADIGEVAELVQMGASHTTIRIAKSREQSTERPPF